MIELGNDEKTGEFSETNEKTRFLEATFDEVKKSREALLQRKKEIEMKLNDVRQKEAVAGMAEKDIESKLKDLLKIEARFEEVLSEEEILKRQEELVVEDLDETQKKLNKVKKLYEKFEADE